MDADARTEYDAWRHAEAEAEDADAALRLAFMKHAEGISGPPATDLIHRAQMARHYSHARMRVALHSFAQR